MRDKLVNDKKLEYSRGVVAIVLSLEISRAPRAPERFRALFRPCVRVSLIRMMDRMC